MPQVRFAPAAIHDLERLREFLRPKNPIAARHAGEVIVKAVQVLGLQPQIGRPIEDMPDEFREWIIDFGDSGYVARYRIDPDAVTILAVRPDDEIHNARPLPNPPPAPARSVPAESGSKAARSGETGEGGEGSLREVHVTDVKVTHNHVLHLIPRPSMEGSSSWPQSISQVQWTANY